MTELGDRSTEFGNVVASSYLDRLHEQRIALLEQLIATQEEQMQIQKDQIQIRDEIITMHIQMGRLIHDQLRDAGRMLRDLGVPYPEIGPYRLSEWENVTAPE